jgi:hypothetical protein
MKPRRRYTVSQAKNLMRRAAEEIIDPGPRSVDQLWEFFDGRCVYCARDLNRELREGHIDHADAAGGNHLGNLVLACGSCNGDEKREEDWRAFLAQKAGDEPTFREREARILKWFTLHPPPPARSSSEVLRIRGEIDDLVGAFGEKCAELRDALRRADWL